MNQPPNDHTQPPYPPYPQPGQYGPPPRQLGRLRRFVGWYRVQNIIVKLVVGIAILACVLFVCSAAIAGIAQSAQEPGATPTAAIVSQPTQAPSKPTPTTKPTTPTPAPTLTTAQRVQQLVSDNASATQSVKTTYGSGDVRVQIVLEDVGGKASFRSSIQYNCFHIQYALWTAHISGLDDVDITFSGPATDKYGNNVIAAFGECDLGHATAAKFNWSGLTQEQAWNDYDLAAFYAIIQD